MPGLRPTHGSSPEPCSIGCSTPCREPAAWICSRGSGALGLEALSRGAAEVVFVEQFPAASRTLQEQLVRLMRRGQRARHGNGSRAIFAHLPRNHSTSRFLDPPFGKDALAEYIPMLDAGEWLKVGGLVYLETNESRALRRFPLTGNCSNRSRRARWGIIWRASNGRK